MLLFHVLRERGIWYLVLYDFGIFQVKWKKKKFTSFLIVPLFDVIFRLLSSFLQSSGLRFNSLSMLLW